MRRLIATMFGAAVVALGAPSALAQHQLEVGIGAKGGGLFGGATEIPDQNDDNPTGLYGPEGNWGNGQDPEIYGLFGGGAGGGPSLDIRYDKVVGLETSVFFTNDSTEGTNDINDAETGEKIAEITQKQSTTATHVPLLLKLSPPFQRIRPVFGLGVEFVFQNEADLSYETDRATRRARELEEHNEATAANYTMFQVTAGVEFDAGPVRIPIEFRAGYNLGWDDTYGARAEKKPDIQVYNGAYTGHFGVMAGIVYRWEVDL
jgi:hypothetical protein